MGFSIFSITIDGTFTKNDTPPPISLSVIRVHVTSRTSDGGQRTVTLQMPLSGIKHTIYREPILIEADIVYVELVQLPLGKAILIQYDLMGSNQLYRSSTSNIGQSLVLMVNERPIGARKIDGPIENGQLISFAEIPDDELSQLVLDLKETVRRIKEMH